MAERTDGKAKAAAAAADRVPTVYGIWHSEKKDGVEVLTFVREEKGASGADEVARRYRRELEALWAEKPELYSGAVDYRVIAKSGADPVYFAERETRVRGGTR